MNDNRNIKEHLRKPRTLTGTPAHLESLKYIGCVFLASGLFLFFFNQSETSRRLFNVLSYTATHRDFDRQHTRERIMTFLHVDEEN